MILIVLRVFNNILATNSRVFLSHALLLQGLLAVICLILLPFLIFFLCAIIDKNFCQGLLFIQFFSGFFTTKIAVDIMQTFKRIF